MKRLAAAPGLDSKRGRIQGRNQLGGIVPNGKIRQPEKHTLEKLADAMNLTVESSAIDSHTIASLKLRALLTENWILPRLMPAGMNLRF